MNISAQLAWGNLWRNRRRTWLTVGAMIFSNMLLVFMISLQLGSYQMMIDNTLRTYSGHLQIQQAGYQDNPKMRSTVQDIQQLSSQLRAYLGNDHLSARSSTFVLASSQTRSFGIQITGVEIHFEKNTSTLPAMISSGHYFDGASQTPLDQQIVIGEKLARNLKVTIGDEITLLGSGLDGSFAAAVMTVSGIFSTGMAEIDRHMAQIPLQAFNAIFSMQNQGHVIAIQAENLDSMNRLKQDVSAFLANHRSEEPIAILDWTALNPGLKQAIQADFTSAWFMYAVLIVLVAFSVLNTQLMSVLERTREFGTMMALGVKPGRLARLVLSETLMMSCLGLLLGVAGGLGITLYLEQAGFSYPGMEEMTAKFNLPDRMYPTVGFLSILLGPSVVFIGCLLAAIYPALRLYFLQPIEAMRAV